MSPQRWKALEQMPRREDAAYRVSLSPFWGGPCQSVVLFALKNTKEVVRGGDKPVNLLSSMQSAEQVPKCGVGCSETCHEGGHRPASSPSASRSSGYQGRRRAAPFPGPPANTC